jgi:hypothetical protein
LKKYCSKRLLAALLYLSFDGAKNWVEDRKTAVVSKYEELLFHGVFKDNFHFLNIFTQSA